MVCSARRFVLCLALCCFGLVFFGPFGVAIASLGEERAYLGAFRAFVRFVLVWFCRFLLPLVCVCVAGGGGGGGGRGGLVLCFSFVRFALVWYCLFPLRHGFWEGLRFVVVALPGLFSYPFLNCCPFQGGYSTANHFHCNSSIVVTCYMAVHFLYCFHVVMRPSSSMAADFCFLFPFYLYCCTVWSSIRR